MLIIIDELRKMIYYKPVKITINALSLANVMINILMQCNDLLNSIVSYEGSVFTSKF